MTSVIDLWRGVDPEARLVSGSTDFLSRPVRGIARTRSASPHLPPLTDGQLLVVDAALLVGGALDSFVAALHVSLPLRTAPPATFTDWADHAVRLRPSLGRVV